MTIVTRDQVADMIDLLLDDTPESFAFFPFELEPEDINNGLCEEFARAIVIALGHPDNVSIDVRPGHVFVRLHGGVPLFFDAETPWGVDDVNDLPFFQRIGETA